MPISDIEFLDSLIGFAVTNNNTGPDTGYVLKTTNGGDNWSVVFQERRDFSRIIFISDSIGYTCGGTGTGTPYLYKTTNQGENWFLVNSPLRIFWDDMSVLNEDTIWLVDDNNFNGGVFRTTNGGQNWTQQYFNASGNPNHIYMLNGTIGFMSTGRLYKTTNSGLNWNAIPLPELGFVDMYFINSLTGWKVRSSSVKKTTDGGLSWTLQTRPSGGMLLSSAFFQFSNVNNDTIWGVGGTISYGPGNYRGIVWKTTNGGNNWGYQIPDTNIHIVGYWLTDFINKLNGWAYHIGQGGVHTVTGGNDTTFYTGINHVSSKTPKGFKLYQNYPNPFNPLTKIRFELPKSSFVKLIVYNILGKEIGTLVNEKLKAGSYEVSWDGSRLPSGIYFYRLMTMPDGRKAEDYSETKRMILIK